MKFPLARNKFSSVFCFYSRCGARLGKVRAGLQALSLSLNTEGEVAGSCGFQSHCCLPHAAHWRQKQTRCRINPPRCWELPSYHSLGWSQWELQARSPSLDLFFSRTVLPKSSFYCWLQLFLYQPGKSTPEMRLWARGLLYWVLHSCGTRTSSSQGEADVCARQGTRKTYRKRMWGIFPLWYGRCHKDIWFIVRSFREPNTQAVFVLN